MPIEKQRIYGACAFAAGPASIADLFRCTPAKVSTHAQSQTKLLPPLGSKRETVLLPSGRDPSPLTNTGDDKTEKQMAGRLFEALSFEALS